MSKTCCLAAGLAYTYILSNVRQSFNNETEAELLGRGLCTWVVCCKWPYGSEIDHMRCFTIKAPKELATKDVKSITAVLKAPAFYVNLVKAPRRDLNVKAARLQHGGLHTWCTVGRHDT